MQQPPSFGMFDLTGRVAVITGGAGLLGRQHARALAAFGAIPVLADLDEASAQAAAAAVGGGAVGRRLDVTRPESARALLEELVRGFGRVDILVNNAARNPKVEGPDGITGGRLERLVPAEWEADLAVGLSGAVWCSQVFGGHMAAVGRGVILNIASDLALIAPDQRLYEIPGAPPEGQPRKPVSYSVVKSGLLGLTRYLATYWAAQGVRVNALCPGGVENGQPRAFLDRIERLIPMGRMGRPDELQGAVAFLCSDASSYMTGAVISVDGGRTTW